MLPEYSIDKEKPSGGKKRWLLVLFILGVIVILAILAFILTTDMRIMSAGRKYDQAGNYSAAVASYQSVLDWYPDSRYAAEAQTNLGIAYQKWLNKLVLEKEYLAALDVIASAVKTPAMQAELFQFERQQTYILNALTKDSGKDGLALIYKLKSAICEDQDMPDPILMQAIATDRDHKYYSGCGGTNAIDDTATTPGNLWYVIRVESTTESKLCTGYKSKGGSAPKVYTVTMVTTFNVYQAKTGKLWTHQSFSGETPACPFFVMYQKGQTRRTFYGEAPVITREELDNFLSRLK